MDKLEKKFKIKFLVPSSRHWEILSLINEWNEGAGKTDSSDIVLRHRLHGEMSVRRVIPETDDVASEYLVLECGDCDSSTAPMADGKRGKIPTPMAFAKSYRDRGIKMIVEELIIKDPLETTLNVHAY